MDTNEFRLPLMMYKNIKLKIESLRRFIEIPRRIVILLTNPRSGSTWLFDALRCHPAIYMHPRASIYESLGLHGRRYPLDLSDGPQATLEIEVTPEQWAKIPEFSIDGGSELVPKRILQSPYAVEKCHPHFFEHDIDAFLSKINLIDRKSTVRLIYQIRDPKDSLVSFLRYQQRNPSWNAQRSRAEITQHMQCIYDSILKLAENRPGLVIDYDDMVNDFNMTVEKIFDYLWPEHNKDGNYSEFINIIETTTDKEKYRSYNTLFLGKRRESTHGNKEKAFDDFFSNYVEEIAGCYRAYQSILSFRSVHPEKNTQ